MLFSSNCLVTYLTTNVYFNLITVYIVIEIDFPVLTFNVVKIILHIGTELYNLSRKKLGNLNFSLEQFSFTCIDKLIYISAYKERRK